MSRSYGDISPKEKNLFLDNLETYVLKLESTMIIPRELMGKKNELYEAIRHVKKFISKGRKGKRNIFQSDDEWNHLNI